MLGKDGYHVRIAVQEGIEAIAKFRNDLQKVGVIAISGGGTMDFIPYLRMVNSLVPWKYLENL